MAIGGNCLADLAVLRAEPKVFGPVASDPTVSRLIATLAADPHRSLAAINDARASGRAAAWQAAGQLAPDHRVDAGAPPAVFLRPGNDGANTAADHKKVLADALVQLPCQPGNRVGRKVLVRADAGGGTHRFLEYLTARRLAYSIGFGLTEAIAEAVEAVPASVWTPAYDTDGGIRDGAWVAEVTGMVDLSDWPAGMRLIIRRQVGDVQVAQTNSLRPTPRTGRVGAARPQGRIKAP